MVTIDANGAIISTRAALDCVTLAGRENPDLENIYWKSGAAQALAILSLYVEVKITNIDNIPNDKLPKDEGRLFPSTFCGIPLEIDLGIPHSQIKLFTGSGSEVARLENLKVPSL